MASGRGVNCFALLPRFACLTLKVAPSVIAINSIVYHWRRQSASVAVAQKPTRPGALGIRRSAPSPALAALLDHVAEELAREYVRLMDAAAREEGDASRPRRKDQEA